MKPRSGEAMARLTAADPARDTHLDDNEQARLWQLIAATATPARRPSRARTHAHLLPLALMISALLAVTAGSLAASGVFRVRAPTEYGGACVQTGRLSADEPGAIGQPRLWQRWPAPEFAVDSSAFASGACLSSPADSR